MAAMLAEGLALDAFAAPRPVGPVCHAVFFNLCRGRHEGIWGHFILLGFAGDIVVYLHALS